MRMKWNTTRHGTGKPKQTRRIISQYRKGRTMQAIADELGLSKARIHQILIIQAPEIIRPRGPRYA